jgi:hypothetical protein
MLSIAYWAREWTFLMVCRGMCRAEIEPMTNNNKNDDGRLLNDSPLVESSWILFSRGISPNFRQGAVFQNPLRKFWCKPRTPDLSVHE